MTTWIIPIDTYLKENKQQPTTSKKSSHNTLDWVEKQLMEVRAFDMGISIKDEQN